jgi:hypothetical protein
MYLRLYHEQWNAVMQGVEREERTSGGRVSSPQHASRAEVQSVQELASKLVRPN